MYAEGGGGGVPAHPPAGAPQVSSEQPRLLSGSPKRDPREGARPSLRLGTCNRWLRAEGVARVASARPTRGGTGTREVTAAWCWTGSRPPAGAPGTGARLASALGAQAVKRRYRHPLEAAVGAAAGPGARRMGSPEGAPAARVGMAPARAVVNLATAPTPGRRALGGDRWAVLTFIRG